MNFDLEVPRKTGFPKPVLEDGCVVAVEGERIGTWHPGAIDQTGYVFKAEDPRWEWWDGVNEPTKEKLEASIALPDVLYRVTETSHSEGNVDINGEWRSNGRYTVRLHTDEFQVKKHTPKGCWIEPDDYRPRQTFNGWRFVAYGTHKRFAHLTIDDAMESFIARKRRQASIYRTRCKIAHMAMTKALVSAGREQEATTLHFVQRKICELDDFQREIHDLAN